MNERPRIPRALLLALIMSNFACIAAAADSLWNHNGSTMRLQATGDRRVFIYDAPRAGMAKQGVQSGTTLFQGVTDGNRYSGTARIFSRECGAFEYPVEGESDGDGRRVVLRGQAPRINDSTCSIKGHKQDSLVFEYLSGSSSPGGTNTASTAQCRQNTYEEFTECVKNVAQNRCSKFFGESQKDSSIYGSPEQPKLTKCFHDAVEAVVSESGMQGMTDVVIDVAYQGACFDNECRIRGGGRSYGCSRIDAKSIRECKTDLETANEKCWVTACAESSCRSVCARAN